MTTKLQQLEDAVTPYLQVISKMTDYLVEKGHVRPINNSCLDSVDREAYLQAVTLFFNLVDRGVVPNTGVSLECIINDTD